MKTTVDIPDDIAREVRLRAEREGREPGEEIVRLLNIALLSIAEREQLARLLGVAASVIDLSARVAGNADGPLVMSTDSQTGFPIIDSPPGAPIRSMNLQQIHGLIDQVEREEDFERAGLPVRQ